MRHPVDVHVGQRVRQLRWVTGLTQQQLGDRVGIKFQQIQKYETGVNRVSASRLWDIAVAMDVQVAFFFEGMEGEHVDAGEDRGDIANHKESLDLIRTYYAIPETERGRLFDLARVLSEAA